MLMKNKILQKLMYESSKNASYETTADVLMGRRAPTSRLRVIC